MSDIVRGGGGGGNPHKLKDLGIKSVYLLALWGFGEVIKYLSLILRY